MKMFSIENKHLPSCFFISLVLCLTLYNITKKSSQSTTTTQSSTIRRIKSRRVERLTDDISCHAITEGDALPSAEDASFSPPPDSIFFHETSCRKGLTSRQACAIESAAKAHPGRKIYVMFSSPISNMTLNFTPGSFLALRRYPNVEFVRVHGRKYAKGTALEKLFVKQRFNESMWKVVHTSDLLRTLSLYKYGGIYLDMDVIVVKPLDGLGRNWVAKQSYADINIAVMNVAKDKLGQRIMKKVLEEISRTYNPSYWCYNGLEALSRVLSRFCNTVKVEEYSNATCHGFKIYDPEVIYPVPFTHFNLLFLPGDVPNADKAYSFHLWNYLSQDTEVEMDSPVETLAVHHCPIVHQLYEDSFGFV